MTEKEEFMEWLESPVTKRFLEVCTSVRDVFRERLEKQPLEKNPPSDLLIGSLLGSIRTFNGIKQLIDEYVKPSDKVEEIK
jgi:hypothetical protein